MLRSSRFENQIMPHLVDTTDEATSNVDHFYEEVNPNLLSEVPNIVLRYKGNEKELYKKLFQKYGKTPGGLRMDSSSFSRKNVPTIQEEFSTNPDEDDLLVSFNPFPAKKQSMKQFADANKIEFKNEVVFQKSTVQPYLDAENSVLTKIERLNKSSRKVSIVLVGLPGSGKFKILDHLISHYGYSLDDISLNKSDQVLKKIYLEDTVLKDFDTLNFEENTLFLISKKTTGLWEKTIRNAENIMNKHTSSDIVEKFKLLKNVNVQEEHNVFYSQVMEKTPSDKRIILNFTEKNYQKFNFQWLDHFLSSKGQSLKWSEEIDVKKLNIDSKYRFYFELDGVNRS
eukprot:snap_masked-scaffold_20-processed-gene-5.60-mRNA-1 protein AED:1.00 eAED:1.00 QI:0/0/0/0/1/1/2/0/340